MQRPQMKKSYLLSVVWTDNKMYFEEICANEIELKLQNREKF